MPQRVTERRTVFINGTHYQVARPVQSALASVYPGKIVTGDTTKDSNPNASVLALSDFRGGIGLFEFTGAGSVDRIWWGPGNLRHKGDLVLPPLITVTAASGESGALNVNAIIEFQNSIYADFGGTVYSYNNETDAWTSVHTLPESSTDALVARMPNGTVYMVFATLSGYSYTSNGTSWTDGTTNAKYLTIWDEKLWGIDWAGQLWVSNVIGSEANDAILPLEDGSVTDLFVGRDAAGSPIIYAMTKTGLFAHDVDNKKFVQTEMGLPSHPDNGSGSTRWRGASYIPSGLGIYKYADGSNPSVLTVMGPDRDDGIPSTYKGTIQGLVGSHNELFALISAVVEAPAATLANFDSFADQGSAVMQVDDGYSFILGWNEIGGWQVKWLSADDTLQITTGVVSSAYSEYRLWFGHNQRVNYLDLPTNIVNPSQVTTETYAASATLDHPWFTADQDDVNKVAIRVHVHVTGASSNETVTVSYATNYSTSFTSFAAITSNGITTYEFPNNSTKPYGTVFRSLQFRTALARGSTNTNTPHVRAITLEYRKKLPAKWGHVMEVDISERFGGNSPQELRANLLAAVESATLVEFTFRDDDGDDRNFYGDVVSATGLEETGHDESGVSRVSFVER